MSSSPNNDSSIALRINAFASLARIINPNSQIGPEPLEIPVTGYLVVAEMVCHGKVDYKILGFRAEVRQQTSFQSDGTMIKSSPKPYSSVRYPDGLGEATRLEIPHFEILLDRRPPLVRPALKADGLPARPTPQFPFTLHSGEYRSFFLAPVTHNPDKTAWSLYVIWEVEGKRGEAQYGTYLVTGDTGWKVFDSQGARPASVRETPAHDHWDIQYNPLNTDSAENGHP